LLKRKRVEPKQPAEKLQFRWQTLDKRLKLFLIFSFIFTLGNSSNQFLLLRATAIGLHATLVGVGLFPASLFAGLLWKFLGVSAPFYFGGFMGILSSIAFWFILKDL
jgi:hypothetical protein